MNRLIKWPLLCGLVGFTLARTVLAADALYQNDGIVDYPGNISFPPVIDATNFVNNNSFTINFTTFTLNTSFYETSDTINYTNNGLMAVNTGFKFDTQFANSGLRTMAGNFNNPGTISCAAITNGGNFFFFFGAGQFTAWATNIINSGSVDVGVDGLMQFTGENVDLTRSQLSIEGFGQFSNQGIFGVVNAVGTNTNGNWAPVFDLTPTNAVSSGPAILNLVNSTPYFQTNAIGTNTIIVRAVFLYNPIPNVTNNVYFGGNNLIGPGAATVEWLGTYLDAASGATLTNYLYLNNDYLRGSSTNVIIVNGIPDNFTFLSSTNPLAGPNNTPSGFPPGFAFQPAGAVTNTYSYVNAQVTASTVNTNSIANRSITNLPGRIQISASKNLNLSLAQITGLNYLSLKAPNQFDGSAGARIAAPYADINIGVTNGYLTVTNLIEGAIPNWSGSIQAWSGRWIFVDASGVTNDYRVLLVSSLVTPTVSAQVQDLILHGTNSIVISDTFNVMRTFSADAQNLTLTTNISGFGATSLDGELNLTSASIFWQSSLPNVRNLTNNGAIRTSNQANFGSPFVVNTTPSTPAVAATGTLSQLGGLNVTNNDNVTIGASQYTFVTTLQSGKTNQIKVGATFDSSMSNFIAAINLTSGSGTKYSTGTTTNPQVTAGVLAGHAFTVTAITAGVVGNSLATTTTSSHLTWNGHGTLTGGVDYIAGNMNVVSYPYDSFINNGLISDQGSIIYASSFRNTGIITNGVGSFTLQSQTAVLTNGAVFAGGDVSITADSLVVSNVILRAGRSLTLQATNLLTDTDTTNGNFWSVGGSSSAGLKLTIKPVTGDLRRTTITNTAPASKNVINVWAGQDRGVSTAGYTNNEAVGRLILNAVSLPPSSLFTFNGASTSNALYVDYLEFQNQATNRDASGNLQALSINTNLVIYYAQAFLNGVSVAEKINHKNNDHLRWIPAYAGNYSSTNLVFTGVTNTVNAALAQSLSIDSDGDGIPNGLDSTPFFGYANVNLTVALTNVTPVKMQITWQTIPNATNYVLYKTNLAMSNWLVLTNFVTPVSTNLPPVTVSVFDSINLVSQRYYQVRVDPNSVNFYGP